MARIQETGDITDLGQHSHGGDEIDATRRL
jgi:hypothetical protein